MALRLGTESKWKVIAASLLGVVALIFVVKTIADNFGGTSAPAPVTSTANSTSPSGTSRSGGSHAATKVASTASLDPTLHPELMAQTEMLTYSGSGRNIFSQFSAPPKIELPVKSARPMPVVDTGPPPPPPPPAIDLRFFGFSSAKSGNRKVFLLHGEDIFIAAEGDIVDRRYRVMHIQPFSVQVEDIPYNNTQTLPLIAN